MSKLDFTKPNEELRQHFPPMEVPLRHKGKPFPQLVKEGFIKKIPYPREGLPTKFLQEDGTFNIYEYNQLLREELLLAKYLEMAFIPSLGQLREDGIKIHKDIYGICRYRRMKGLDPLFVSKEPKEHILLWRRVEDLHIEVLRRQHEAGLDKSKRDGLEQSSILEEEPKGGHPEDVLATKKFTGYKPDVNLEIGEEEMKNIKNVEFNGKVYDNLFVLKAKLNQNYVASLFAENIKGKFAYSHNKKGWFKYDGKRWKETDFHQVLRKMNDTVDYIHEEINKVKSEKVQEVLYRAFRSLGYAKNLMACVNLAKTFEGIALKEDRLDEEDFVINLSNGSYNLLLEELKEHKPQQFLSNICNNTAYKKDAQCPNFKDFLNKVFQGDKTKIDFLQEVCGYLLTGSKDYQAFFIFLGNGNNGKSTLIRFLAYCLGNYSDCLKSDVILKDNKTNLNQIAQVSGKRFVYLSETSQGQVLNDKMIKVLTSTENLKERLLYENDKLLKNTFKFILTTNHMPIIKDKSAGLNRRIYVLNFDYQFKEEEVIPDYFVSKLTPESSGFLNWAIEGYKRLSNRKGFDFQKTESITSSIERVLKDHYISNGDKSKTYPIKRLHAEINELYNLDISLRDLRLILIEEGFKIGKCLRRGDHYQKVVVFGLIPSNYVKRSKP